MSISIGNADIRPLDVRNGTASVVFVLRDNSNKSSCHCRLGDPPTGNISFRCTSCSGRGNLYTGGDDLGSQISRDVRNGETERDPCLSATAPTAPSHPRA